jgi:hypothetical protein
MYDSGMSSKRYPENQSPLRAELNERDCRFADAREEFLIDFGYNTARAYWGDLEHLRDWATSKDLGVLELTTWDFDRYVKCLKRNGYSPNTIRRRTTTFNAFRASVPNNAGVTEII